MSKLERLALKYRINLAEGEQPDQPSITTLAQGIVPVFQVTNRQAEYERLKREFQEAKERLQNFVNQDKAERQRVRRAGLN